MKVYIVYGYPEVEGAECEYVERLFYKFEDAETYMEKENAKWGWRKITGIQEMEVL